MPPLRTALILVLDDARPMLEPVRERFDPDSVAAGIPLHVTVLVPFVERAAIDEAGLAAFFAARVPFRFALSRLAEFPDVVYAVPRPDEELLALMRAVHERFPETPPYGGEFDEVIPHATLAQGASLAEVARACESLLPLECAVDAVTLIEERSANRWHETCRFQLGGA